MTNLLAAALFESIIPALKRYFRQIIWPRLFALQKEAAKPMKRFACPYAWCTKRFTQKGAVSVHVRIHAGDRPFGCSFCSKKFTQKSNATKHEHTKHTAEIRAKRRDAAAAADAADAASDDADDDADHDGDSDVNPDVHACRTSDGPAAAAQDGADDLDSSDDADDSDDDRDLAS